MKNKVFKSFLVTENNDDYEQSIVEKNISDLPNHEVLIQVKYSSLNYKDALSSIGNKGVTKEYPHTPGIDAAGLVVESKSDTFNTGEKVIVTGYDLGMNTSGGFQEYIRVPAEWIVPLPENLILKESMIYGTAGFTAALSVHQLISDGLKPSDGKVLVTGATGGVGSTAIRLLDKLGYKVVAATGKLDAKELLHSIGASEVIDRKKIDDDSKKPLLKTQWAGVIDTVGGNTLSTAIKMTNYGGNVTTCGNVAGHQFDASVYPFILRGITLYGIDSVQCPKDLREEIWTKLAGDWKPDAISKVVNEIGLEDLPKSIDQMLNGTHTGRTLINLSL